MNEKKDENDPSFDGLRDVDSFASSEATLTEEYLEMHAQNSGVYAHARSSSSSKESTEEEEDDSRVLMRHRLLLRKMASRRPT